MQLAPDFAPVHVANIRALAKGGWWNGAAIYRVQDNYVAQWGNNESDKPSRRVPSRRLSMPGR
jgi:peptidylprolyl isomerase